MILGFTVTLNFSLFCSHLPTSILITTILILITLIIIYCLFLAIYTCLLSVHVLHTFLGYIKSVLSSVKMAEHEEILQKMATLLSNPRPSLSVCLPGASNESTCDWKKCLAIKFISGHEYAIPDLKEKFQRSWSFGKAVHITEFHEWSFLLKFSNQRDVDMVVDGAPWLFSDDLMLFERCDKDKSPRNWRPFSSTGT